mgnify:CR=1 FL=1
MFSQKFISATREYATYEKAVNAPYMRRSFTLDVLPEKADFTVTGLGFYRVFINGTDITKGLLAPYISNDDQVVYYDRYDITPYLHVGKNTLAFLLGNGFHNCIGGNIWVLEKALYRSAPKLAFALALSDGTVIEADETVLTHPSPILFDDIRCGVHYDARKELVGWQNPDFDDSDWQAAFPVEPARGKAVLCGAEPIRIYDELAPVRITPNTTLAPYRHRGDNMPDKVFYDSAEDDAKSGYLYDFGQNNAGVIRLKIKGTPGQRILLQACERLDSEGRADFSNIGFYPNGYSQRDIYICRGEGEEIFVPDFTYHGFRYMWVSGITEEQATKELLTYLVAGSDLAKRGDFSCSDAMANRLWEISLRSDRSNLYYFPTDCPHREKNGWTGDASMSAEHMTLKLAMEKTYSDWLISIRGAQNEEGALPGIVPTAGWGFEWGNGPIWDSVAFNLPYYTFRYRGDRQIIRDNAEMMMRYLHYALSKRDEKGLLHIGLGDWCPVGKEPGDYDAPLELTDTACVMDCAKKAAVMFRAIGAEEQARFADDAFSSLRGAIRKHLIDFNTMTVLGSCQSSQAIAIALNVFEPAEKSEAFTRLVEFIEMRDEHFDTGFYGMRTLLHVLSDFGAEELAYHMITRTDAPSFGYWVEKGATTLYESFDQNGNCGASLNHHFWGEYSAWFMKTILGIRVNPGDSDPKQVDIEPKFLEKLDFADGYYDTVCGKLSVSWKRDGDGVILNLSVPQGVYGRIKLPFGYRFEKAGHAFRPLASGTFRVIALG